eukprot:1958967-Prymnesium_polylepis.1
MLAASSLRVASQAASSLRASSPKSAVPCIQQARASPGASSSPCVSSRASPSSGSPAASMKGIHMGGVMNDESRSASSCGGASSSST